VNAQEAEVHFKGILANVDLSILKMDFNHGFKIESFSEEEAANLFFQLENIPRQTVTLKYFFNLPMLGQD
jgi:hypothetical protein